MQKILKKHPMLGFLLFGLALASIPLLAKAGIMKVAYITTIGGALIYAIAALGLNILLGFSGLISLGTAGFMGLAAYISAYLTVDMHIPFEVSLVLAVLIPTLIGVLVGLVSLKIEGLYLAIATLAVSEILRKTFEELDMFTNGFSGKSAAYPVLLGTIKLDLTGQCCSESIGPLQFSGTGGQADTATGAQKAVNGRSFIALYSTAMVKDRETGEREEISKIVPMLKQGAIVPFPGTMWTSW